LYSERRRERKFGGANCKRALGMRSSPGALNESREWIMEISSWRVKGVSRTEGGEEGVGERQNNGAGRLERRVEMWAEKELTIEETSDGDGIGWILSQFLRGDVGRETMMRFRKSWRRRERCVQ
jgi:hypothetical protein